MAYGDYTKENWKNKLRNNPSYKYVDSEYEGKIYHTCYSDPAGISFYNDGHEYPWVVAYRDDSDQLYQLWFEWNPDEDAREESETMVADWYSDVFAAEPITENEDETVEWLNESL